MPLPSRRIRNSRSRPAPTETPEETEDLEDVAVHEVDLSEEWAALSQQIEDERRSAAA